MDEMLRQLRPKQRYFTLLLVWNATEDTLPGLPAQMQPIVDRGLVYFCAWGKHCEQVHDSVDQADIRRMARSGSEDYVAMTTWHENEPLSEVLWYFQHLALPTEEPYSSSLERFAVSIGDNTSAEVMRTYFAPGKSS